MAATYLFVGFLALVSRFWVLNAEVASSNFGYSQFSSLKADGLLSSGDASITNGELWLTADRFSSYGRIMRQQQVQFCDAATRHVASFSTDFSFVITRKNDSFGNADGFAFVIAAKAAAPSSESYGRWLALVDPDTNGLSSNKLVAVEFDTFQNTPGNGYPQFQDIDNNHVGLDVNSILSINSSSLYQFQISLGSGSVMSARIQYDGRQQELNVYVGDFAIPVLEHRINLCDYIDSFSYVGFSGGSGTANVDFHRIKSWKFSSK